MCENQDVDDYCSNYVLIDCYVIENFSMLDFIKLIMCYAVFG